MTTLADVMEHALESAREVKEGHVAAFASHTDMTATIMCFRGEDLIAIVKPPQVDRDQMLNGIRMCAFGMGPDLISVVMETFMALGQENNPRTGEPWGPGDMQDLVENHRGREQGWIVDALTITVCNRAGDLRIGALPYRIRKGKVQWLPDPDIPGGADPDRIEGVVPDAMREYMTMPSLMQEANRSVISDVISDLGAEKALAHQDMALATVLTEQRFMVVLSAEPGTLRARMLADRADAIDLDGEDS